VALLRLLFSKDLKHDPAADTELLMNSDNGILIKKITDGEFEFHDTGIRSLFQESMYFDLIFKDGVLYLNILNDDKEGSSIAIHYPLGNDYKYIYIDLHQSDNIQLRDIRFINFIERKYLKSIFIYQKRLSLDKDARFTDIMDNGDYCEGVGPRKTIVEYKCDFSGNAEILVK
jgi:hypothetical protein